MSDYAQLGDIRFDAGPLITATRTGWALQSISDWLTVTRPRNEPAARQSAHGDFAPGVLWREGSVHTLTVSYYGTSVLDLEDAVRALNGLADHDGMIPLTVSSGNRVTHRDVWIESVNPPDHHLRSHLTDIEIDVKSDSPFAYGEQVSTSCGRPTSGAGLADPLTEPLAVDGDEGDPGRVQFANAGTASTPLLLTITGGGMTQGVRLRRVETGDTMQLDFPVLNGQTVVFDGAANRVTLDNQSDMTGYLTRDDWFDAPPGGTTTVQFEPLGDVTGEPRLTLTASPAWY